MIRWNPTVRLITKGDKQSGRYIKRVFEIIVSTFPVERVSWGQCVASYGNPIWVINLI